MTLVLGIDPGLASTGWALVADDRRALALRGYNTARSTPTGLPTGYLDTAKRVVHICAQLDDVMGAYKPTAAALEAFEYHSRAFQSSAQLNQLVGAILQLCQTRRLEVRQFGRRRVLKGVVGRGDASKKDCARAVAFRLGVDVETLSEHTADAAAVAIMAALELRCEPATREEL